MYSFDILYVNNQVIYHYWYTYQLLKCFNSILDLIFFCAVGACNLQALNYPGMIFASLKTNLDRKHNLQWLNHSYVQPNKEGVIKQTDSPNLANPVVL